MGDRGGVGRVFLLSSRLGRRRSRGLREERNATTNADAASAACRGRRAVRKEGGGEKKRQKTATPTPQRGQQKPTLFGRPAAAVAV